jgi:hypothetical protein
MDAARKLTDGQQPDPTLSGLDHIFNAADLVAHFYPEALLDPTPPEPEPEPPAPKRVHLVQVGADDLIEADADVLGTALNTLLSRLEEAEQQLQSSSFRIGYLQAEIDRYKEEVKLLPDFEAQARRAADIERQNFELRKQLPELEQRTRRLASLQQENESLQIQIQQFAGYRNPNAVLRLFSVQSWIDWLSRR